MDSREVNSAYLAKQLKKAWAMTFIAKMPRVVRHQMVMDVTGGRTNNLNLCDTHELGMYIQRLERTEEYASVKRMRSKCIGLLIRLGYHVDGKPTELDWVRANKFLEARGAVKKPFSRLNRSELPAIVTQLESMTKFLAE